MVESCTRSYFCKGYCRRHYKKWWKYGTPLGGFWEQDRIDGTIEERFWPKVDVKSPSECWIWKATTTNGYGKMDVAGRTMRAHEISMWITTGEWSTSNEEVLHSCDVRKCVNPAHLSRGTQKRNWLDAIERRRLLRDPITGQFKTPQEEQHE